MKRGRRVQGQALRGPFLSRFLSNPLYSEHAESEETGFSPSSNPFAIRPAARTPTGAHIIFKQGVTPPQATPSADGEFFDLDLTLGFTPTPAPEGAGLRTLLSEPKANSWLSSADDELENLQESWDSVSKQIIPLDMQSPSAVNKNKTQALSPLSTSSGDTNMARAWLREHAKSPNRVIGSPESVEESSEAWKIMAGNSQKEPASHSQRESASMINDSTLTKKQHKNSVSMEATPKRHTSCPPLPLSVPSPAYEYPRSFALDDITNMSSMPSATGSFKSWLNNRSVSQSTCNSHDGIESVEAKEEIISSPDQVWDKTKQEDDHETYQQAVSAVPNRMSPATGAATLKKFAEDARSADLAEEHDKPSASVSPTHTRMSVADTVICLVALVVALGLALIMPTSMVTPASNLTTFPSTAVLPQGLIFPKLSLNLHDWASSWRQLHATFLSFGSERLPQTASPTSRTNLFSRPIKANPPPPSSWVKPEPPLNTHGTSFLSKLKPPEHLVASLQEKPAVKSRLRLPETLSADPAFVQQTATEVDAKDVPHGTQTEAQKSAPTPVQLSAPAAKHATAESKPWKSFEGATVKAHPPVPGYPAFWVRYQEYISALGSKLGRVASGTYELVNSGRSSQLEIQTWVPVLTTICGACMTTLLFWKWSMPAGVPSSEKATNTNGQAGTEAMNVDSGGKPGIKSRQFSHMKLQRPPTTTPAVGGRAHRRQSNVAVIEYDHDDDGMPSVAPHRPVTRSAVKAHAGRTPQLFARTAGRTAADTVGTSNIAGNTDTPATLRRSRRLAV